MIKKQIQHLILLEVSENYEEENDFENENELAKEEDRSWRRIATQNMHLIR